MTGGEKANYPTAINRVDLDGGSYSSLIEEVRSTVITWFSLQDPNLQAYQTNDGTRVFTVAQFLNELLEFSELADDWLKSWIVGAAEHGSMGIENSLQILRDETARYFIVNF